MLLPKGLKIENVHVSGLTNIFKATSFVDKLRYKFVNHCNEIIGLFQFWFTDGP